MKYTNLLFIISLLITCSLQETVQVQENLLEKAETKIEEHLEAKTELNATIESQSEAELQSMVESQLGTEEESKIELEEEASKVNVYPANYFVGNWLMYGYGCNRNTPKVEKCKCKMEGTTVICTKTLGDDCVTTGTETFRGVVPAQITTRKIKITYVVGNARKPNSGHWRNSMYIHSQDEFRSQRRRYVRDSALNEAEAPKPVPVPVVAPVPVPVVAPRPIFIAPPAGVIMPPTPTIAIPAQRLVYYYTNYFLGNWNGVGYVCDAATPKIEVVNIKYHKGRLYGTKLLGDNCVPAMKLSFEGVIPGKLWMGLNFPVKLVIGSPQYPAARQVPDTIRIIDLNTFQIGVRTFYRSMGPNAAHPHGVYINMTPLVGKGGYPGPGFIKLNPKKNMRSPVRRFVIVEEETNKPGNC